MEHRAAYNRPDVPEVRFLFELPSASSRLILAFSLLAWSLWPMWWWAFSCCLIGVLGRVPRQGDKAIWRSVDRLDWRCRGRCAVAVELDDLNDTGRHGLGLD